MPGINPIVAITGAAGNLGGLLARHMLANTDADMRLLIHRRDLANDLRTHPRVSAYRCDLAWAESLVPALAGADCVVHFAGVLFKARPERFLPTTNTEYFRNLLSSAIQQQVRRIVLISFPHVEGETTPDHPATGRLDGSPASSHARNLCDPAWRRSVTLTRGAVDPTGSRAYGAVFLTPTAGENAMPIGVITLPAFYGQVTLQTGTRTDASKDVTALIERFSKEKIVGLVLDLRGNGGGYLDQAITIAGLFIGHRAIIRTKDYMAKESESVSPVHSPIFNGPMVVLVDDRSASASEIVAGALRDYGRALVVGSRTHGNGIVQTVLEFRNLVPALARSGTQTGAAKFTVQQFFLPNGDSPQLSGLDPEITLPIVNIHAPAVEALHPIPAQKCPPFAKGAKKTPADLIKRLVEQSETRQATLADLLATRRLADHLRNCGAKPFTLEIATRRRERDDEQETTSKAFSRLANSPGRMPCRSIFLDAKRTEPENETVQAGTTDQALIDPTMAEAVRIVRDAVEAKWIPGFN